MLDSFTDFIIKYQGPWDLDLAEILVEILKLLRLSHVPYLSNCMIWKSNALILLL